MLLYRPVGQKELELIFESGMLEFPVRLPEQPLFYPVINRVYAQQIARDWNTKEDTKVGYVTKFEINNEYIKSFEEKIVGSTEHKELWVPAEQVSEFNKQIIGSIEVVDVFFGEDYAGVMPSVGFSNVKNANEFLIQLKNVSEYNKMDFICFLSANKKPVFINYFYWEKQYQNSEYSKVLDEIKQYWTNNLSKNNLVPEQKIGLQSS